MHIPDYLIYDEIKRRRQQEEQREERKHLELPLYRPEAPPPGAGGLEEISTPSDRGVTIIDINDWLDSED